MSSRLKEGNAPRRSSAPAAPGALKLLLPIAQAAFLVVGACFALPLVVVAFSGERAAARNPLEAVGALLCLLLVSGLAAWWMFRKLQAAQYTRREARAVSLVFGLLAPAGLSVGLALAIFAGGYAASLLGDAFALVGAFAGTLLVTALLSFGLCAFALWMTRRIERIEKRDSSAPRPRFSGNG